MPDSAYRIHIPDRRLDDPFGFERALYVAADDPLSARAVNYFRAHGLIPPALPIRTDPLLPAGFGFLADGRGSGEILIFEERQEPTDA